MNKLISVCNTLFAFVQANNTNNNNNIINNNNSINSIAIWYTMIFFCDLVNMPNDVYVHFV